MEIYSVVIYFIIFTQSVGNFFLMHKKLIQFSKKTFLLVSIENVISNHLNGLNVIFLTTNTTQKCDGEHKN